jgi:flagellar basal-body rod protein FlgF
MINRTYVGISGQLALQRRLDTIANNVANTSTAGFRAEQIRFGTSVSHESSPTTAFATAGETYLSRTTGEIVRTDGPLDVAVEGDAWLAVQTPQGIAYSRDGRMQLSPSGELRTLTGHQILDAGGSPILLDPTAGPPSIARDGAIAQSGRAIAVIGLYTIDAAAKLARGTDATVVPDIQPQPAVDSAAVGVKQGFIERSTVNPVTEMTRLILNQRMFEAVTNAMAETEQTMQGAIRTLGAST